MGSNNQQNQMALVPTFSSRSEDDVPDDGLRTQPRQPRNLQGLLRFAMEATKSEDASNSNIAPLHDERRKFLEDALNSVTINVGEVIQNAVKVLSDGDVIRSIKADEELPSEVQVAFDNLMGFVDDIDNAVAYYKLGGYAVFPLCFGCDNGRVRAAASSLLAELCQNNPFCQGVTVNCGLNRVLIKLAETEQGTPLAKELYAISCIVRGFEPAARELVEYGGCDTLMRTISNSNSGIRTKSAFLIKHLCETYPHIKAYFIEKNLVKSITDVIRGPRDETTEHMLGAMVALVDGVDPVVVGHCTDPDLGLGEVLQRHLRDPEVLDGSYREEKEYCEKLLNKLFRDPLEEVER